MTAPPEPRPRRPRSTSTARFGSGRRESHDASAFYERFVAPELSTDAAITRPSRLDVIHRADARDMHAVETSSVALVVTSPPYFAGKEYEESLGHNGVPGSYLEYLELLRDVFGECKRVLEPGGRIAVNVANLGRRPYRSLAGDVTQILQDLGLLLRGEVVWWKGRAAGGSCAWGTFQRPGNPVLRDVTERIVIASKGRFDRAIRADVRARQGLPSITTVSRDEFMEATTDLWEIPPERATRVGHPAPFPVQLPARLIHLYTYEEDLVLDPFMGSGTTAVAALQCRRHYVGYETDATYVRQAQGRVAEERERLRTEDAGPAGGGRRVLVPALGGVADEGSGGDGAGGGGAADGDLGGGDVQAADPVVEAVRSGRQVADVASAIIKEAGFADVRSAVRLRGTGLTVDFVARDRVGGQWVFEVSGAFTSGRSGLGRVDALWRALGRAAVVHQSASPLPLVLLTTDAPAAGSPAAAPLRALTGPGRPVLDVVELLSATDRARLRGYAERGRPGDRGSFGGVQLRLPGG